MDTVIAGAAGQPGFQDGVGSAARFDGPAGVALDTSGNVYVADQYNHTIRRISASGSVTTLAGLAAPFGSADGPGPGARFSYPGHVALDAAGNLYVSDLSNNLIRKITPAGIVSTIAGTAGQPGSSDGVGTAAQFSSPGGLVLDGAGNIYVADTYNRTIRKIAPTGEVSTLAGMAALSDYQDGIGTAARFLAPQAIARDGAGNLYVTDACLIRRIAPNGTVTTVAGSPAGAGYADGTGTAAAFNYPNGLVVDASGTIYVADNGNCAIRRISSTGVVTTLAGSPSGQSGTADGTGSAARFAGPTGIALDDAGNLFVTDWGNHLIRKVTSQGVVTTIGGDAQIADALDGVGSGAWFDSPYGIAADHSGSLYIADSGNNTISKGVIAGPPVITVQPTGQTVTPGAAVQFSVTAGGAPAPTYQWLLNGSSIFGATGSTFSLSAASASDAGAYTVVVSNALGNVTSAKAALSVGSVTGGSSGGSTSGGGGGGAMTPAFVLLLSAVGVVRALAARQRQKPDRQH